MAKNKNNRDRKQPQSERSGQRSEQTAMEREEHQAAQQLTPGDMTSRKRQKRFGHN